MSGNKKTDGDDMRTQKENHLLLEQEKLRQKEELVAITETQKRLEKQKQHEFKTEETKQHEMKLAETEMAQRNAGMQLVKDHEMDFEKQVTETYQAKTKDEALKVKQWEEERILEDLEMEEKIKMRNDLLKQKLLDFGKAREEAEEEARNIEATTLASSKALQAKNIEEIALEKFHEEEQRRKAERVKRNEMVVQKKDEIDQARFELEQGALVKEKEKRAQTLELQKAEFNRYEKEIKKGKDSMERLEENRKILQNQIETEKHEAELLKLLETKKKSKQDLGSFEYDGGDEERLRVEALKRRQQQQQEMMNQQEQELEQLMTSQGRTAANDKEESKQTSDGKKKGFFSNLFGKR